MDKFIFTFLAYVGVIIAVVCGYYQIKVSNAYDGDYVVKANIRMLGITDLCVSLLFLGSLLHIDGLATISSFAMYMRPFIILLMILPAFISYRMAGGHR